MDDTSACACGCSAPALKSGVGKHLPLLPTIALVLLPKCPLCLAALGGILGALGAGSWLNAIWGTPLAIGLLSIPVGTLALRTWRSREVRPLLLGVLGAISLLTGKCLTDALPLTYAGLSLLAGASLWSLRKPSPQTP